MPMKLKMDDAGHAVLQDGKPVYVHDDGKEVTLDPPALFDKVTHLTTEAQNAFRSRDEAKAELKKFEGIEDPDAARAALDTVKNLKDGELVTAGKVAEIKSAAQRAAEEQVAQAMKASDAKLAELTKELEITQNTLHEEKIGGAFSRSKFIGEKIAIPPDLLRAQFGKQFKLEDGRIVALDENGQKVWSRNRPGEVADFDEAIEILVDKYPHKDKILVGTGAAGGGARQGVDTSGKTITRAAFEQLPPEERAKTAGTMTVVD